jgi:hypothetical protein
LEVGGILMDITQRRVIDIKNGTVTYERVDETWLIIHRTVSQHIEAVGKPPAIGDIIEFETYTDYDGSISNYRKKQHGS